MWRDGSSGEEVWGDGSRSEHCEEMGSGEELNGER